MLVRMWMSTDLATAGPEMPAGEALKLMAEKKIRRLPILSEGKLAGVVTLSDLTRSNAQPSSPVSQWMAKRPATIGPDAPIEEAGVLMRDRKIGAVPVVENGKLVGLITESDVFRALIEVLGLKKEGTRIAVEMPREPESIYRLMELLAESGRELLSVVIYSSYSKDHSLVVLRVQGADAQDLVKKLWEAKYTVVQAK